jgi:hypothetical protein
MVTIEIELDTEGQWHVSDDADEQFIACEYYDCEEYVTEQEANEDARDRAVKYAELGLVVLLYKCGKIWADA